MSLLASVVDIDEAYEHGRNAVRIAVTDGTGYMSTILRRGFETYAPYYDKAALDVIANSERHLPRAWITPDGHDVTDDFVRYARPLLGEENPPVPMEHGLQALCAAYYPFIDKNCRRTGRLGFKRDGRTV